MKLFAKTLLVLYGLVWANPVFAGNVKLFLDNTRTDYLMVEEQDCSVHKTKDGKITLGFKAGNMLFSMGPEITFGKKEGIDWDHTVQGLVARYQELCARFNTGSISKQEYDQRLANIESIETEAYELYQEFLRKREQHVKDIFDELDDETRKFNSIKSSYEQINRRLDLE